MISQAPTINSLVIGLGSMAFGKERRAVRTFKHLRRVKPYFLTSKWEDGSVTRLLRQNDLEFAQTSFGYLGRAKPLWTLVNVVQMPVLFVKMISAYLRKRCNVIVVLNITAFLNALPSIVILKYFFGARVVFYLGDTPKNYSVNRVMARLINWFSNQVITNSEAVRGGCVEVGVDARSIRVIYNGVDIERFEFAKAHDFRGQFGWPNDTILVGFAGQFRPNKGGQDFIEAAELILRQKSECRFLLIGKLDGDDTDQKKLADYIQASSLGGRVVFAGWADEIESFFTGLDVVVVPSRHQDPAPNVAIEAMASGVPVVATMVGGTPEIVSNGETGFLVEKERPDLLAECVVRLASDRELRRRMGLAGRERVRHLFDIRKNALEVEEVLIDA